MAWDSSFLADRIAGFGVGPDWWNGVMQNILYLAGLVEPSTLSNKSGGSLTSGDVVVVDTANDTAVTTTATASHTGPVGVALEAIGVNAAGRCAFVGIRSVRVTGTVGRGDYLETSTTPGSAKSVGSVKTAHSFARALSADSGGYCTALLLASASGGTPRLESPGYFILPANTSAASDADSGGANHVRCIRIHLPSSIKVASIHFNIPTGEAGKFASVGIYSEDGTTRLITSGAVSIASTGVKSVALGTPVTLAAGMYWLAWTMDSTTGRFSCLSLGVSGVFNGTTVQYGESPNAGSGGAVPTSLGTVAASGIGASPMVKLQA